MSTQLAVQDKINPLVKVNLRDVSDVAGLIFQSRTYGDIKSKEEAAIKIIAGTEYGFDPFQSMTMIDFIQGRPTLNAHAKATLIKSSEEYEFKIVELTNTVCKIDLYRKNDAGEFKLLQNHSFTWEDAVQAELTTGPNRHSWKKYPRNMLFARCISNIWRWNTADLNTRKLNPAQIQEFEAPELEEEKTAADVETTETEAPEVTVADVEAIEDADVIEGEVVESSNDTEPDVELDLESLQADTNARLEEFDAAKRKTILKGRIVENLSLNQLEKLNADISEAS